jgi:hypothetical protein
MKSARHEMQELLQEYAHITDSLLDYTDIHHHAMHWDIMGYAEQIAEGDYDELEDLQNQVKAVRMLLDAHKALNYIFC